MALTRTKTHRILHGSPVKKIYQRPSNRAVNRPMPIRIGSRKGISRDRKYPAAATARMMKAAGIHQRI
jgi:hypothetical protein